MTAAVLAAAGCAGNPRSAAHSVASSVPSLVVGTFEDDHGGRHTVSATEWWQGSKTRYDIVVWDTTQRFLIARNHTANASDAGKWTRIDWVPIDGMQPYEWAFCFSAYDAPTRAAAEGTTIARPETPMVGCNGFPFSRMKRIQR